MAIDIFWQKGKDKRKIGEISVQESLLLLFSLKTGVAIDEYGTTRLSTKQLDVLIQCANELEIPIHLTLSDDESAVYLLEGD